MYGNNIKASIYYPQLFLKFWHLNWILEIKTHDSESQGQEEAAIIRKTKIT